MTRPRDRCLAALSPAAKLALACAALAWSFPSAVLADSADEAFYKAMTSLFEQHRGAVGAAVKHLESGKEFAWNADTPMPTASLIKFPLMIAAYRQIDAGKLRLDEEITLQESDKVPGSGVLTTHFGAGVTISLRDAIQLMIAFSDNTATNLVADKTGIGATAEYTASVGCPETRLHSKVYRRDTSVEPERSRKYGLGSTTAEEMIRLYELVHAGEAATPASTSAMLKHLRSCDDSTKVVRRLPVGTVVAHKTGAVSNSRTDAGIIESPAGPIAYCILTTDNADRSWGNENEAELLAATFGRAVYDHFVAPGAEPPPPAARVLKVGDDGLLVEALQRTLNARTSPTIGISADGDFGPNTERAVKVFQKQAGLKETGRVDAATWKALGALVTSDAPQPAPEEINDAELSKAEADELAGPPLVTCKAYAIADGATGEVLWGLNADATRDPASTTKMMTAHLVTKLAATSPEVLDQTVVFSKAADDTPGSSSTIRAGETLPVSELLYAVMLPSGNDATVAMAEHFGDLLDPDPSEGGGSVAGFVRAMNAEATRLGMDKTGYRNTHGLTAAGHVTSARDLATLVHEAMQSPLFRELASTRRRGAMLGSVSGYQRNVVWNNTNRLLRMEGFDGVKTGTTGPAGACLASTGVRDGRRLIVIVLGATSSDARYVDSRNLYRWAWTQLSEDQGVIDGP